MVDVSIKESAIDKRTNRQSGYGFVHFSCDKAGVECAFQAVSALDNATVNGVTYYVELSKNLLKQFNEMQQGHNSSANVSPTAGAGYAHHARAASFGGGGAPAAPVGGGGPLRSPLHQQQHSGDFYQQAAYGGVLPRNAGGYDGNAHYHHQQQQQQHQLPPQYMHPTAHEYYQTDDFVPPPAPSAAPSASSVPLGYSPKTSGYGSSCGPPVAPRPLRPTSHHVRDSSLGSMDPTSFGLSSARSFSGSTSPLPPPYAVSPAASSHGSLTPTTHSMSMGSGRYGGNNSNNTSMHSVHEFGVSPPRSGEEHFLLMQQQQSQQMQAQQLGLSAIRPGVPRLQINTGVNGSSNNASGVDFGGVASLHHTTPMHAGGHKVPFTPSHANGRQQVPQFAEMLAQELRPYEQQQQMQYAQGMFPVGPSNRSPMNRSVGGFDEDPERLMGPRSRAGTVTVPPLNLSGKSPMAAAGVGGVTPTGYGGMVQKSFSMQQHQQQQMMQTQQQHQQHHSDAAAARHRRTLTGEMHDLGLTFEGLTMTPNGLGSFVELSGDRHGASYSPLPAGLSSGSRSTDSSGSSASAGVAGVPPLVFDTNLLSGGSHNSSTSGGGALSTAIAAANAATPLTVSSESSPERINSDGLVSQAIKLLSPPSTPRDYAVLLGVNFL